MKPLVVYLIAINFFAFLLYTIDFHLYQRRGYGIKLGAILNLSTIVGGSVGTIIAEFLWDRSINKLNMQSRVYTLFWLFLHTIFLFVIYGPNHEAAKQIIAGLYASHKFFYLYFLFADVCTFIAFVVDKIKACTNKWRIREVVLMGLVLIGGSAGGLLAMDICNHKVQSMQFVVGVPLMLIAHMMLIFFVSIGVI